MVLTVGGARKRIAGPARAAIADLDKSVEVGITAHADLLMNQDHAFLAGHANIAAYFRSFSVAT